MVQNLYEAQHNSDSAISDKPATFNPAIQKFLEQHYSESSSARPSGSQNDNQPGKLIAIPSEKNPENVDIQKLLEQYPINFGQDNHYIEQQWKAGAVDAPTKQEQAIAMYKMKDSVNALLNDRDKEALNKAQEAILMGEPKAFTAVLGEYKNNPEKLKAFVDALNQNFKENNTNIGLSVQGEHVKIESATGGGFAEVDFDTHTGKNTASFGTFGRASFDGSISKNPEIVLKRIGNTAIQSLNKTSD